MRDFDPFEWIRFTLGLVGLLISCVDVVSTITEARRLSKLHHDDEERRIVARGWVISVSVRAFTCAILMATGWLLISGPPASPGRPLPGVIINWLWATLAVILVVQSVNATITRRRLREILDLKTDEELANETILGRATIAQALLDVRATEAIATIAAAAATAAAKAALDAAISAAGAARMTARVASSRGQEDKE